MTIPSIDSKEKLLYLSTQKPPILPWQQALAKTRSELDRTRALGDPGARLQRIFHETHVTPLETGRPFLPPSISLIRKKECQVPSFSLSFVPRISLFHTASAAENLRDVWSFNAYDHSNDPAEETRETLAPVDDMRRTVEKHYDAFFEGVKDAVLPLIAHPVDTLLLHPAATALLGTAQKLLPLSFSGIGPGEKPSTKPIPWKAEDYTRACGSLLTNAALFWGIPKGISVYQNNRSPVLLRSPDGRLQVREVRMQHSAEIEKVARSWYNYTEALLSQPDQLSNISRHTIRSFEAINILSDDIIGVARASKNFSQDCNFYWFTVSNKKGHPLGLMYVHCSPRATLEIEYLVTNPNNFLNKTKGAGTLLFEMAETLAVIRGNGTIEADALSNALSFYKAKGCTIHPRYHKKVIIGHSISKTISKSHESLSSGALREGISSDSFALLGPTQGFCNTPGNAQEQNSRQEEGGLSRSDTMEENNGLFDL